MTKEDNKNFKNFTKCWICHNDYVDNEMLVISLGNIEKIHIDIVISNIN